jgi:deoxyribonuclease-4
MIGAHLSRSSVSADRKESNAEVVQIFVSNPRGYQPPPSGATDGLAELGVPVYVHLPYLVNPASADESVRERSRALIAATDAACAGVIAGIVIHGGQGGPKATVAEASARWVESLTGLDLQVPLLVENTAGGNAAPGRNLDDLAALVESLRGIGLPAGICFDTCHGFAAGYEDLESAYRVLRDRLGQVDLVHLNDSRDPLGSARDRHALVDTGTIGLSSLASVVAAAVNDGTPVVLETPGTPEIWRNEINLLRSTIRI